MCYMYCCATYATVNNTTNTESIAIRMQQCHMYYCATYATVNNTTNTESIAIRMQQCVICNVLHMPLSTI